MKRKPRQPRWKGLLPTSGEFLGTLAMLCDWKPRHSAKERTWRKFCHGESIHQSTRHEILKELVESLVGKLGQPQAAQGVVPSREEMVHGLLTLIQLHAAWWDLLCERIQSALPAKPTVFTTTIALRLALVELVMRLSALFMANDVKLQFPTDLAERQVDATRLLLPYVLREVTKSAGITRLELAEALDVSREAVDQWLESTAIIPPERVDDIAEVIAEKMGIEPTALGLGLQVVRRMSLVLMPLADMVGKEELGQLLRGSMRLLAVAQETLPEHTRHFDAQVRTEALSLLVTIGSESPLGAALRGAMLDKVPDEQWRRAIATSIGRWGEFLAEVASAEVISGRLRHFLTEQDFPSREEEMDQLRQHLLLPKESRSGPYMSLLSLPSQERDEACLLLLVKSFDSLAALKQDEESLQSVGLLSEFFGMMAPFLEGELKSIAEEYRWRSLILFVVGSMGMGQDHLAKGEHQLATLWVERMMKVLRALPPIPEQAEESLKPLLKCLRLMKRMQEDLDAGRAPSVSPRDFTFLDELKAHPTEGEGSATLPPS
ncbi:MAG TPA: hypothetical protein VK539_01240 [Myxococcaceae bacterium]|nr:hypothetical protein [Myxococcaceae bacterium]